MHEYQSGTYCSAIQCRKHEEIAFFSDTQYFEQKKQICRDCAAWQFYCWLNSGKWKITGSQADGSKWTVEIPKPAFLTGYENLNEAYGEELMRIMGR